MSVEQEILVTGIKVVDLLAPYAKGGKIGMCVYILPYKSLGSALLVTYSTRVNEIDQK